MSFSTCTVFLISLISKFVRCVICC